MSPTSTPSPTPRPRHCGRFSLGIYAPNGERICELVHDEPECEDDEDFQVTREVFCPRDGQSAAFLLGGQAFGWDGRDQGGDWVQSGLYWVKLDRTDSAGKVSSISHGLTVLDSPRRLELSIFDAAGELVRAFDLGAFGAVAGVLNVDSASLAFPPSGGCAFHFSFAGRTGPAWDGRNSGGTLVEPGVYLAQLLARGPASPLLLSSLQLTVLEANEDPLSGAFVAPNPVPQGLPIRIFAPGAAGCRLSASLYDLAGRVLAEAGPAAEGVRLEMDLGSRRLPGGIYMLHLSALSPSGRAQLRLLKFAVEP